MKSTLTKIWLFVVGCSFAGIIHAQSTNDNNVAPDLLARNATPMFDFENFDNTVVRAAGMELLFGVEKVSDIVDDILNYAFSFEGTRYRRGGKTPSGFDCSGFTGYIFSQFGYPLNADSRSQYLQGRPVDNQAEVKPGDLLFFSGRAAGKTVGHVGIAVEVNNETGEITFIHSATSSGVRLDSTQTPYYGRRYLGARRIIE